MKLEEIGFYTLEDRRVMQTSVNSSLWRCELILTDRCNFNCPYCGGVKKELSGDLDFDIATSIVNTWSNQNLQNIRFSGGEPTLYNGLFDLVRLSKNNGIKRIAISTNGSADLDLYLKLIELGVNDFSISLDACCSSTGSLMSGRSDNIFEKISKNIFELSKITYVTVGIVVTDDNINELSDIILYADSLKVSDIRVISAAQQNRTIEAFKLINNKLLSKHSILRYRSNNYKNGRDIRGIKKEDSHKCALVIDDMAVAKNKHYPCIIYLREKGNEIGNINSDFRKERYHWFMSHNCYEDDICRNNCLDVCVDYNNKYKKLRG